MGLFNSVRLEEYREGKKKIDFLKDQKDNTLIIHYSCESFFNLQGRTPRITSIAVKNRDANTSEIFSIHLMAQIMHKDLTNLTDEDFDAIEKAMLDDFHEYVQRNLTHNWVHWNMKNASYGFPAISNRYRILGGVPIVIDERFKYDLSDILGNIYTFLYEKDDEPSKGKLLNLSIRNNISTNDNKVRDALTGKDEADAFDRKDFLKLHMSTMKKVELIDRILTLEEKKLLKTLMKAHQIYGLSISGIIEIVKNNRFLFGLWSVIMAVLGMALEPIVQNIFGTGN